MYHATAPALPVLHATGHTPNLVTLYSLLCGCAAAGALWLERPGTFVVLYILSYVLDCMDGALARRYNMTSPFGDWFDHLSDWVVLGLVLAVVWHRRGFRAVDLVVALTVLSVVAVSSGCEQRHRRHRLRQPVDGSAALDLLVPVCPCRQAIHVTRFAGTSPGVLFLVGYVWWIFRHRR